MKNQQNNVSNLLIVSNNQTEFQLLSEILAHYFPNTNTEPNTILVSNKYYQAEVRLENRFWSQLVGFQDQPSSIDQNQQRIQLEPSQSNTKNNYDLMIMLVSTEKEETPITPQSIDCIIQQLNPQQFVILVNTGQLIWKHQETLLEKCNNFIEVVKDDLLEVRGLRPKWMKGLLLGQTQETEDRGIFSILDRIETTMWSNLLNNQKKLNLSSTEPKITQKQQNTVIIESKQTPIQKNKEKQTISEEKVKQSDSDQEIDESKLQQQMLEFESMMGQMMSFKMQSATMKDDERKVKAEELFSKMFKGMIG